MKSLIAVLVLAWGLQVASQGQTTPSPTAQSPLAFNGALSGTVMDGATDLTGVVIRLRPSAVLRGRVVLEHDPSKPVPATAPRFSFFMDPASARCGGRNRAA